MSGRRRVPASLVFVIGVNLLLASAAGLLVPAHADQGIGGYDLVASAAATRQIFRPENNIVPTENLLDLSAPYAVAGLTQGSAHALSSTLWPGDTFANACAAFPDGFPSKTDPNFSFYPPDAPRAPIPCDTYRAETFFPQGPADAKPPFDVSGTTTTAHSDEKESTAKAEVTPQGGPGAQIGSLSSNATSSIKGGKAVSEAVSQVGNIVLGDGVVRIESVISKAKAVSDGTASDAQGSTVIQGFTIANTPVSVTQDGVSISGQPPANVLGQVIDPVNTALKALGMSISLSKPAVTKDGSKAQVSTGGLQITFDNAGLVTSIPADVRSNVPVDLTGKTTLVFGSASASTDASPGFGESLPPGDVPPVAEIASTDSAPLGPGDTAVTSTDVPASTGTIAAPAPTRATVQAARASVVNGQAVGFGLILLAMVGAIAAAVGLHRLGTGLFEPIAVTNCPQEKP
jgi:hypothetical protein